MFIAHGFKLFEPGAAEQVFPAEIGSAGAGQQLTKENRFESFGGLAQFALTSRRSR